MMWTLLSNAILLAVLLAFSHGLLKWVATKNSDASYTQVLVGYWWAIGLAIGVYVFILFYYAYVLRYIDVSSLYPIYTGLSIVLVFLAGTLYFGEPISTAKLIGCLLITGGVILMLDSGTA